MMFTQFLIQLLLFLLLVSVPVFCCVFFQKSFESTLAAACTAVSLLLFLFGLAGILRIGVYAVILLCTAALAVSVYRIARSRSFSDFCRQFFTPGFFVFLVSYAVLTYINYGRPLAGWDEFSHWGDIVKIMLATDKFGTAPGSGSLYQSYPPCVSLFQYLFQRITVALTSGDSICEWRLFFAYQLFFVSFLLQFLDGASFKKTPQVICAALMTFLAPMVFFTECYAEIYIDPFIGIVSGAGLALVFTHKKHDTFYFARILLSVSLLVLVKDAGMLFALFLLIAFMGDHFIRQGDNSEKTSFAQRLKHCLPVLTAGICAFAVPKLLWSANIRLNDADVSFSNRINTTELINVILGRDDSYRSVVWANFWRLFTGKNIIFGTFRISVPCILLTALFIAAVLVLAILLQKRGVLRSSHILLAVLTIGLQFIVYIFGLCVIYMFKFTQHEAVELASWSRYMFIAYLSCWIFIIIMLIELLRTLDAKPYVFAVCALCMILVFVPLRRVGSLALRNGLEAAVEFREERQPLVDTVFSAVGDDNDARINVISQESTGFDFIFMHYALRPYSVSGNWSIGTPFYEGDHWTVDITADEWRESLISSYDYVVICNYNDYFVETYGALFSSPEDIRSDAVYRVCDDGTLELCAAVS